MKIKNTTHHLFVRPVENRDVDSHDMEQFHSIMGDKYPIIKPFDFDWAPITYSLSLGKLGHFEFQCHKGTQDIIVNIVTVHVHLPQPLRKLIVLVVYRQLKRRFEKEPYKVFLTLK